MTVTLKVNARNDIHIPADLLRLLNLGKGRVVTAKFEQGTLVLIPVDLEPRYTHEELEGLDHLHEQETKKGWIPLKSEKDVDDLLK